MNDALSPKPGIVLADEQRLAWLRLIRSQNIGPATFIELIKRFGTASNALDALPDLAARGGTKNIRIASQADAEQELARIANFGATTVCMGEPDYPPALRAADGPPPLLTVKGSTEILNRNCVAFVGSRNASLAGVKLTKRLAAEVGQQDYAIVSGLARGIDAAAHEASLDSGTIAVLAGGINDVYPTENVPLLEAIIDRGGAAITEMKFGHKPRAQDFPRRNRIVAGMSLGLVVVEAAKKSGSLISARLANEMGRLVFAVPGSPLDPRSDGANHLIKQGAQLITGSADVLEAIDPVAHQRHQIDYTLDETDTVPYEKEPTQTDREKLTSAIGHTPVDIDEVIRFTEIDAGAVHLIILEMELASKLERHAGNRVSMV